jgi:hypothetical protein
MHCQKDPCRILNITLNAAPHSAVDDTTNPEQHAIEFLNMEVLIIEYKNMEPPIIENGHLSIFRLTDCPQEIFFNDSICRARGGPISATNRRSSCLY